MKALSTHARAKFLAAAALLIFIPAGCFHSGGQPLDPAPPTPQPPTAAEPPATSDDSPPAEPTAPAPTVTLPFVETFDDDALGGWYPIGRGLAKRTAGGELLLEETQGSLGFALLHEGVFPDRIAIEFDCQPLRFEGHPSLLFAATRSGAAFATDPKLQEPDVEAEVMKLPRLQFYMLGWHMGWRAVDFPRLPGETRPTAKALLQRHPEARNLAAVPDAGFAPDQKRHRFRIVKDGGRITVEVDGVKKMDVLEKQAMTGGHIGFRIRGGRSGSFRCLIDNLKVTALP